ncbi:MAG: histidine--tRNA ligase [Victivallaceae bacterium]|nr:histidine--tRNA ligase [Victivallaceae bacterium]
MSNFSPVPGTADIFPAEATRYRAIADCADRVFGLYGYGELRTPIFEYTEVFQRGLGGETEVVQKEMYTFQDRGGRSLTLRPEGTAGVMRAMMNTGVMNGEEQRVYYFGPMFRGERPAAGRRRQFHQVGVENVGRISPALDAECIAMLVHFLDELGIQNYDLKLNTRGVQSDRPAAAAMLQEYFGKHLDTLCDDCKVRYEKNIWRILDCKQPHCQQLVGACPDYLNAFSEESRAYFDEVRRQLDLLGVRYTIDPLLVRGLDYYVHTVFELGANLAGSNIAIAGGGRYELFLPGCKKPVPGVGFAAGVERLLMAQGELSAPPPSSGPVFLISLGDAAFLANLTLAGALRRAGVATALEPEAKSMKSQMRAANRLLSPLVIIRGDGEMEQKIVMLKKMSDGSQSQVADDQIISTLKGMLS